MGDSGHKDYFQATKVDRTHFKKITYYRRPFSMKIYNFMTVLAITRGFSKAKFLPVKPAQEKFFQRRFNAVNNSGGYPVELGCQKIKKLLCQVPRDA